MQLREEQDYIEAQEKFKENSNISLAPLERDVKHLKITIRGREGTPYVGGSFVFEIEMPTNYPFYPPLVFCITPIWHPNIDTNKPRDQSFGNVCLNILNPDLVGITRPNADGWTPRKTLVDVLEGLLALIQITPPFPPAPYPKGPLAHETCDQYWQDEAAFLRQAKEWTKKHATPLD